MKKFEILRYLKRFSLLIFLVSLAGAAAIYLYADGRQKYTASVIIRYTNDGISDGYTPDGSELDVNEIYSSTVISQAMDALGASGRLSTIRSNISVTPVISEDQQTINEALLQKGEEVTYFPDTYKVSLVVDGEQGAGYARNMLDAIIQSYCTYYTEKYVEQKLSLNPSSGLLDNGYDYYECIRILENDTNEMQDYLLSKREHYPNFRSSRTGYTYADLCDIYSDFKKYTIPALYAYVLNGPQVRDGTVLQEYLANTIETAKQNEQITTEQRDSLWSLTDQYVYKNADLLQNYFTDRGEVVSSDYILNNIELEGAGDKAQTTYDGLVLKLVSLEQQVASSQIDRQFQEEILQSFRNVDFGGTSEQHAAMESMINDYEAQLKSYYEIINTSQQGAEPVHQRGLSEDDQLGAGGCRHQCQAVPDACAGAVLCHRLLRRNSAGPHLGCGGLSAVCGQKDRSAQPRKAQRVYHRHGRPHPAGGLYLLCFAAGQPDRDEPPLRLPCG